MNFHKHAIDSGRHGRARQHRDKLRLAAAYRRPGPFVTSIKSGVGHTCGGSGLLSLVMAVLALRQGTVPPIRDLVEPIPEARDLRLVVGGTAVGRFQTAQVHAIGLGGINAVAVVEQVPS